MTKATANQRLFQSALEDLQKRVASLESKQPIVRQSLIELYSTLQDCVKICAEGLKVLDVVLEGLDHENDPTDRITITEQFGSDLAPRAEHDRRTP